MAWKRGDVPWACREALKAQSLGSPQPRRPHPGNCGVLKRCGGGARPQFPTFRGELPALKLCLQARGLGQSSQLRGLAALLLPGNRGRGGASRQLMGCPSQRVYTHGGDAPRYPAVPTRDRGAVCYGLRQFRARVYCSASGSKAGAPGRAVCSLPLDGSLFCADLFSSFCG